MDKNHDKIFAFSLVQMAIIISVLSFIVTSGAVLGQKYLEKHRFSITESRIRKVETALLNYVSRYGYFPCPAGLTETLSDIYSLSDTYHTSRASSQVSCSHSGIFSSSDSDFRMGAVPWQELNLPYEFALDGWNRKILYTMPHIFYETMTVESYSLPYNTNLVYWFDAADLSSYSLAGSVALNYHSEANNVKLSSLADSNDSGSISLAASGTLTGDEPVFYVHTNANDNFPVLRFDGVDDELEILGHSYSSAFNNMHLFVVVRYTASDAPGEAIISYDDTAYYELGFKNEVTDKLAFYSTSLLGTDDLEIADITSYNDGDFHVIHLIYDNDGSDQITVRIDGSEIVTDNPHVVEAIGSGTTRYGMVGVQSAASSTPATSEATGYFTGDVAEILLFNSSLSSLNYEAIEDYLTAKWGDNLINLEGPFLTINDISDTSLTEEAIFTLISTGPTGEGGYSKDGAALTDPSGSETEHDNIAIADFPSTLYAAADKDSNDYRIRYSLADFDDIVRYATFNEIKEFRDNRKVN